MTNKQKVISILSCLTIGGVGGHHIDDIVEKYNLEVGRYPIKIEYKITANCVSSHTEPMKKQQFHKKLDICICALEDTELVYDYENYSLNQDKFMDIFEEKANECKAMRK